LLLPTRRAEDLYAGWWRLFEDLGAVPRVLVWDGEAAVGLNRPGFSGGWVLPSAGLQMVWL
jgi:hypothetical protein